MKLLSQVSLTNLVSRHCQHQQQCGPPHLAPFHVAKTGLVVEGGAERVIFRLLVDMERLEAMLNYESSACPPLLMAAIEDVRFNLGVHPAALAINASLGNLRAQDCGLPEVRGSPKHLEHACVCCGMAVAPLQRACFWLRGSADTCSRADGSHDFLCQSRNAEHGFIA